MTEQGMGGRHGRSREAHEEDRGEGEDRESNRGAVAGQGLVLTGNIAVPLGIVVSIIMSVFWAAWYVSGELHMIQAEMTAIRTEVQDLRKDVISRSASRFSSIDARIWAGQFATMNPTLKVPEPIHYPLPGESDSSHP